MKQVVIMPGGFHPFHAGHTSLYQDAVNAFPNADVYVAATNDTKTRPFPFAIKEKLAKVAGIAPGHFIQVKSPFQPREITDKFNPEEDVVIFVRSEKDRNETPKPGGRKKDGNPAYFQPWTGKDVEAFGKHAYMAYLPTVEFGPGITSATEIRNAWPTLNDKRKTAMVMSLYPATQKNPKLAANVVKMLDMSMGNELDEDMSRRGFLKGLGATAVAGASGNAMAQFANMHKDDPLVQHNKDIDELAKAIYATMVAQRGEPMDRSQQRMWMTIAREKATIKLSQHAPGRPQPQSSSGFPKQGSERRVSKDINNFESKKLNEFAPNDGGDEKSYLLQLADDLADAMYGPNKNKQEVKNVSGKILAAGGNVKITWNDDSTFNVVMYHPTYFKQGHLIRLVGRGDELTEFAPPSSDRDDGGSENERNRRIRKLLEIAIQVAKEKNVDELGMIHAMNMIAGDEFFNTAVEGILPDITDKEYMFVLQSAYKTVKQGLAEAKKKRKKKSKNRSLGRYFFPGYSYYGGSGESGEGGGDAGGEGMAEGVPQPGPSSGAPKQFGADAQIQTRQMTVKDIISSIPGVPYYNNVVDDWDAKDYSWGVTKKVIEYATYLKDHPESLAKLPPAIVLNGKFEDGAHRVSAIWLLQQRMDPKNPLWKNAKLNVQFVKQGMTEGGAETSWSNDTGTITLQDILELTKHIKQINLPINDNLKSKLLHWEGNPEEIERVNQVTVSNQFPILIMVDEQGQIAWILDGNHRLHKAIQSQAKTIPAKLIKPSNLNDKAKKIFNIKEQGVAEGEEITEGPFVQRLGRPNKVNVYVRHTTGKPSLLIATDIPYVIYDKFIMKAIQKYPQFRQTDFSFKSADKLKEETNLSKSIDYLEEK